MASALEQAKWLLTQASLLEVPRLFPGGPFESSWMRKSSVPYGLMHPKTFAEATGLPFSNTSTFRVINPSPTKWALTELLPEGTMILTPNIMPGLEGRA